ncbi:adenylosuccinate lyase [Leucobacter viscericola]|uniref:Adenylosuccinate lyase n=1 Tax=Leucobacter viscericola TaxID=2714935 RepID=A0A6G7XGX1_9MICO|nr:lyase family protein [Leucobacter viscericola]QIK63637.1 adenylosuccinate lyase [Leucobacter viscericola]
MPTDPAAADTASFADVGLLSPVTLGHDSEVGDDEVLGALIAAEVALTRAWAAVGVAPQSVADVVSEALGWNGSGRPCVQHGVALHRLAAAAVAGGNPVIPLVGELRARVPEDVRAWVHRGATSQDMLDSALMLIAHRAVASALADLRATEEELVQFAADHRDEVAAARTLTQHAVPTTLGLRAAGWARGVARAVQRLEATAHELPAQLAGAGGTLASFVQIGGEAAARELPAAFAAELGLAAPAAPWHTQRWPVTELGDALAQATDALGVIAADVATLSRTEIAELAEGEGGGSSAMPQKQNPARAILIRSAALRAPQLAATLHAAAALAVDERPDGAWHAEWPTLRELLRLALGASANAKQLVGGLRVNDAAMQHNLGLSRGLIVAERLSLVLGPVLGADRVRQIVAAAGAGADLSELLLAEPAIAEAGIDIAELLDPSKYTGLAGQYVDSLAR